MKIFLSTLICSILPLAISGTSLGQTTWTGAGGDDNWSTATNWDSGIVPNGTTTDVDINAPSPTSLDINANINSLVIGMDGILNLGVGADLNFGGTAAATLNNQGIINTDLFSGIQFVREVNNSGEIIFTPSGTIEVGSEGATLDGGGTIFLSGGSIISGIDFPTLTIEDQRIEGAGWIRSFVGIDLKPGNTIDANVDGETLLIEPVGLPLNNAGTLQASGGGTMHLNGFQGAANFVDNATGNIVAQTGSTVQFGRVHVEGGSLSSQGDGQLLVNPGVQLFEDVIIDGNMVIANTSTNARFAGTIDNRQAIIIDANPTSGSFDVLAGQVTTLTGGGTLRMTGNSLITRDGGGDPAALILDDQTVEGEGVISSSFQLTNTSGNLIDANVNGGTLQLATAGTEQIDGVVNRGTLQASGGGTLVLTGFSGTDLDNNGGTIQALAGSEVHVNFLDIFGGTLQGFGDGLFRRTGGATRLFDVVMDANFIAESGNTHLSGDIENRGNILVDNTNLLIEGPTVTLDGGGTITLSGNADINWVNSGDFVELVVNDQTIDGEGVLSGGSLNLFIEEQGLIHANVAGSTLQVFPQTTTSTGSIEIFENRGTLRASGGATLEIIDSTGFGSVNDQLIANEGTIDAEAGSTFLVSKFGAARGAGLSNSSSSKLTGGGTIAVSDGNVATIDSAGRIEPGDSIGTLTLSLPDSNPNASPNEGFITLSGQLEIEIGGTTPGTEHDQLILINTHTNKFTTIGGILQVRFVDGFTPSASDEFVILNAPGGYLGTFNSGNIACVSDGGTFDIDYNGSTVTLSNFQTGPVLGDVNLDCNVNLLDVSPFVDLISSGLFQAEADVNEDGVVNLLDVGPFVALLGG